jgi:hypothetical protein
MLSTFFVYLFLTYDFLHNFYLNKRVKIFNSKESYKIELFEVHWNGEKKLFKKLSEIIGLVMHKQITAQNLPILKQEW